MKQPIARPRRAEPAPAPVWYDCLPRTPLGPVWVAVTSAGLAAVAVGARPPAWPAEFHRRGLGPLVRSAEKTAAARRLLAGYLAGRPAGRTAAVDWRGLTDFQRRVLQAVRRIPRGQTRSYRQLAAALGKPAAARAVGQALARNPVLIILPCHRVVAADGALRGYRGAGQGLHLKAWLLRHEGAAA